MNVNYYLEADLIELFTQHQLEQIETFRVDYSLPTGENQVHLVVLGRKK